MIIRSVKELIIKNLFKNKVIITYGARQVGKTTLVKDILKEFPKDGKYISCELLSTQRGLSILEPEQIKAFLGQYKLIVLDEAQEITNIGKILKIIVDFLPDMQIIATGSSSFDLSNKISEPLTGRNFTFHLSALSLQEIINNSDAIDVNSKLELLLRFGLYPEIYTLPDEESKISRLNELASNYLYKDVLEFDKIRHSDTISKLVQLLALQIGQEVSLQELATQLGINRLTVEKYIDLLEKSFIIFKLKSFSKNKRKEISKNFKIYFYDLGIRNSIIQNFNSLDLRTDTGALWENFCILERKKYLLQTAPYRQTYFYRTYSGQEVDYIEENAGNITAYEFKWNDKKNVKKIPAFTKTYNIQISKVTPVNYISFVNTK